MTVGRPLLLAIFVKRIVVNLTDTSSSMVYRRVVVRNVVCTVGILLGYVITTTVLCFAIVSASEEERSRLSYPGLSMREKSTEPKDRLFI